MRNARASRTGVPRASEVAWMMVLCRPRTQLPCRYSGLLRRKEAMRESRKLPDGSIENEMVKLTSAVKVRKLVAKSA